MDNKKLRLVTRSSALAMKQTYEVIELLSEVLNLKQDDFEIVQVSNAVGDVNLKDPLYQLGDTGIFTKQVEQYLLNNTADIAVHSLKDLPTIINENLVIAAYKKFQSRNDVVLFNDKHRQIKSLEDLPEGAVIGTSSIRRIANIKNLYPQFQLQNIRGNILTRIQKLDSGTYDAIILAKAGVERLNLNDRISIELDEKDFLYAPAQGALGIQCRKDDLKIIELLNKINDKEAEIRCSAERKFLNLLEGGCKLPIGVYSQIISEGRMFLRGKVWSQDGKITIQDEVSDDFEKVAELLCTKMKAQGADQILKQIK